MKREKSLTLAIARAKRNVGKYAAVDNVLDAPYEYNLRRDELKDLVDSVNKYAVKNYYDTVEYERVNK